MDAKGLRRATVVGHSMGSFVAQRIALAAPERVQRLVLIGSATTIRSNAVLELRQAINELSDEVPEKFVREFQTSTIHQQLPGDFLERIIAESRKVPARVWRAAMTGFFADDYQNQLRRIKAPTLIIWGDKETIFLRSEQDALVKTIAGARLEVYPETGHSPQWERPERFVKDLEDFISRTK
jgi:pimeloyl-ACP methyl ester carboxylesterase